MTKQVVEIEYKSLGPTNVSILEGYKVLNSTETQMIVHLNFSEPLYVSSFDGGADTIKIKIVENLLFQAQSDGTTLAQNYSLSNIKLPVQILSNEDLHIME